MTTKLSMFTDGTLEHVFSRLVLKIKKKKFFIFQVCNEFFFIYNVSIIQNWTLILFVKFATFNFFIGKNPHGVMVNMLDCNIVVSEFELYLYYHVHFQTNPFEKLLCLSYRLKSTTTVLL